MGFEEKLMNWGFRIAFVVFFYSGITLPVCAGTSDLLKEIDSLYYRDYPQMLTTRVYTSRKYTSLSVNNPNFGQRLSYIPTSTLNLGLGATYQDLTLNLAYGFGFMNPQREILETKYLDLQAHLYPQKFVIDLFGQFYNGYYLELPSSLSFDRFVFPDMRVRKFGGNFQYLFNGEKVSLKAAFQQSAWQQRSAGSFLAGFEFYAGSVQNPFPLLPEGVYSGPFSEFNRIGYFQFGPNLGYVYTLVFLKRFFITGMASGNLSLGSQRLQDVANDQTNWGLSSNVFLRGFVGYNSERWSVNANYVSNHVQLVKNTDFSNGLSTGNYRINFVYRFDVGPKLKSFLDQIHPMRFLPGGKKTLPDA
jgi:hypothetical protein